MIKRYFLSAIVVIAWANCVFGAEVVRGVLDLRGTDLYHDKVYLNGEWGFYWQELLAPEELPVDDPKDYFQFPEIWNRKKSARGQELQNFGAATYTLKVILPDQYPKLALYIKHVYSAGDIYINNDLVQFGGIPGVSGKSSRPRWVPQVIDLPVDQDTLYITLHISNLSHDKGGAREPIVLAKKETIEGQKNEVMAFDLLLSGTLIMTGIFFLGLYFFGMKTASALYFSLFCLTFSYRMIGANDYTLQTVYPDMNWILALKLEYLSLFVPPLFFALYTHSLYTFKYRINPFFVFSGVSGLFATITVLFPPSVFTKLVNVYLAMILIAIVIGGLTYFRAYRRQLNGSKWAMLSSLAVFSVFCYEIFIYIGALNQVEAISFVGYLSFFFCQSIILFLLFTDSLKKAKEEAEHASKTKSEFLSMMSHEIRTPMNAVIGLTNYMIEDEPKSSQVETLNTLKFSAENLLVIINDILDFSKIEADKIELDFHPVEIRDLLSSLQQIFAPIAAKKGIALNVKIDGAIPNQILCDQTRLSQVLTNLIGNALKFTEQGSVDIALMCEEGGEEFVSIRFEVNDTGIGINKARQGDIFESFTQANTSITRQFGGTGLGLTITKRLLALQGADLHLKSEEGKGSSFWFILQVRVVKEHMAEGIVKTVNITDGSLNVSILLVEDNEINVMVARKFLNKWGANVHVAGNGEEAIRKVNERSYDLILMDLQMPLMDGFTAARKMRENGVKIPIIALTASVLIQDRPKIYEAGMNDFVTKPFDPDQLFYKILHLT